MSTSRVLAAVALGALACSETPSSTERLPNEPEVRVASALLSALEQRARVRVLVSTDDVEVAQALGRALQAPRVFDGVPAFGAEVTRAQLEWLRRRSGVRVVALDSGGSGHLAEALPLSGFAAPAAGGLTGLGITVAVIDSGIDRTHPDLAGAVVDEACFCSSGCCPGGATEAVGEGSAPDGSGHGTHVAGIIASRGLASGQPGGAPGVSIIAIKVLDDHDAFCCNSDLVAALDWLLANHPSVDVVNISLGANGLFAGDCDAQNSVAPVASAVDALIGGGAVLVASSGNNGASDGMASPACIADVLSVGAVWDEDLGAEGILCSEPVTAPDRIACFSNASDTLDLLAPGAIITSTWPGGLTRGRAGTSQAAPMVSACAALLRQAAPGATVREIGQALRTSPVLLVDERNGRMYPRLDCGAAMQALTASDAGLDGAVGDAQVGYADSGLGDLDAASDAETIEGGSADSDAARHDAASAPQDAGPVVMADSSTANVPDADASDGATSVQDGSAAGPPPQGDAMVDTLRDAGSQHSEGGPSAVGAPRGDCSCSSPGGVRPPHRGLAAGAASLALVLAFFTRKRRR